MTFLIGLALWLAPLIACIVIGKEKNRNGFLWGFFLGIIGLIVLAILPPLYSYSGNSTNSNYHRSSEKICPSCKSVVDDAYSSCPNCGANLRISTKNIDLSQIEKGIHSEIVENYKINCPKCEKTIHVNMKPEDFRSITCPYCRKKIDKNNVIYI